MYRFFFRFVVTTLTILTANLLTNAISNYLVSYKNSYKPLAFTFLGMAILVVVFYPLFLKLDEWLKRISVRMIKSGNSLAGKYFGLLLVFFAGLILLAYFYGKLWYHINLFSTII
jgi:hypothetical protein